MTKGGEQVANESGEARVGPFASPSRAKDAAHHEMTCSDSSPQGSPRTRPVHHADSQQGPGTAHATQHGDTNNHARGAGDRRVRERSSSRYRPRRGNQVGTTARWSRIEVKMTATAVTAEDNAAPEGGQYPERGLTVLPLLYDIPEQDRKHEETYRRDAQNAEQSYIRPIAAPPIAPLTPVQTCGEEGCTKCESAQLISDATYIKTYDKDGVEMYDEDAGIN